MTLACVSALIASPPVSAAGQIALSAERLFGFLHARRVVKAGARTRTLTSQGFSVGGRASDGTYSIPRVGADYIFPFGLTLGTSFGYASVSTHETAGAQTSEGRASTRFGLAPRVGYLAWGTKHLGLWPSVGLSYFETRVYARGTPGSSPARDQPRLSSSDVALSLALPVVFAGAEHFWCTLGPSIDYGLSHSEPIPGPVYDQDILRSQAPPEITHTDIGLHFSLVGVF